MPPGDDDVTIYGEFRDAISRKMSELGRQVKDTSHDLDELAVAGEAAAIGMDRSSAAAGRLKAELSAVERATESKRLADNRATQAEAEAQRIMAKGVLNRAETARVENLLTIAHRDQKRAADDLRAAHVALGEGTRGLGSRALATMRDVEKLTLGLRVLRGVATADMLTGLIGGVGALGAELVGVVAGVAPLIGVAGAIPALGLAAVTAFGGIKLLTGGIGKASSAIVEFGPGSTQARAALMHLTPAAQEAAMEVAGVGYQLRDIKSAAQEAGLPYLRGALSHVTGMLPQLRRGAIETVQATGDVVERASANISGWGSDLDTIFSRNATLIRTLGGAGINILSSVRHMMIGAGGMTQGLAEDIERATGRLDRWLADNPEKVQHFFDMVRKRTEGIFHVLGAFGSGLVHILMGATPMVDHLGGGITRMADRFEAWASSDAGQASIHKFFRDAIPLADAFNNLLGTLVDNLGRLARGGTTSGLASTVNGISHLIGPLTTLLLLLNRVTTAVPGAGTALGIMAIGMRIPGIGPRGVAGGVRGLYRFQRGARGLNRANESFAGRAGMRLAGLFGGGGAAAAEGAGAAEGGGMLAGALPLLANPFTAAIVGGAALGFAGVELYRHWTPFRHLIDDIGHGLKDAFGWVERHLPLIGKIALGVFAPPVLIVYEIVKHFHDIERTVRNIGSAIGGWFAGLPGVGLAKRVIGMLYAGGPTETGQDYLVGEIGPELLLTSSGMRVVGGDGAELLHATEPGYVLPNHVSVQLAESLSAVPVGGRHGGDWPGPDDFPPSLPPLSIGPFIGTQNEAEVRRWIAEALDDWQREQDRRRRDRR
jgi:hypothetical protein